MSSKASSELKIDTGYLIFTKISFIYLYNGSYWSEVDKESFQSFLGNVALKMGVEKFKAKIHTFKDELFRQFMADSYLPTPKANKRNVLINLQNGTFEITPTKRELRAFNRNDFLTHQLPFEYNPDAKAPLFYKYLDDEPMLHILNTSGVINYPKAQFNMVRIGIGLYGFGNDKHETNQLKNTHNLKSIISQIHIIQPGETVGYNRAFTAKRPTLSATIPIGHADGISRRLGNKKGFVLINNQKAPIIGNVCMDMIMVDVTKIKCTEGDEVIIFNTQEMVQHIAETSETIVYEVLTGISNRVKKVLKS